jgi:hypothetical protein
MREEASRVWEVALTEACSEWGGDFGAQLVERYDLDGEAIDEGAERSDGVASGRTDEGFGVG